MTEAPRRIQRKRSKGWKMPPNTVAVDRSTKWGNPFIVNAHITAGSMSGALYICVPTVEDAVACYRELFILPDSWRRDELGELRGKNLACYCPLDRPCHADVLLELANAPTCEADTAT